MRGQALEWLKSDLVARTQSLEGGKAEDRDPVAKRMIHWKGDSDLAGIRDEKELAKLPGEERVVFTALWTDVDQLLTRATMRK